MHVVRRAGVSNEAELNASRRAAHIVLVAAIVVLPLLLIHLAFQTADMRFPDDPWVSVALRMVIDTKWGITWLAQFACALLLVVASVLAKRSTMAAWTPAALLAFALAATPSTSSHAMSADRFRTIAVYVDMLHVFAASAWIGTLFVMYRSVRGGDAGVNGNEEYLPKLLRVFSPLAIASVSLIALSGLISSFAHIVSLRDFIATKYGITILAKVASVAVVALFGFRNFKTLTPALAKSGAAPMTRGMKYELAAAVVVLLITAALVVTPPPMDAMVMDTPVTN